MNVPTFPVPMTCRHTGKTSRQHELSFHRKPETWELDESRVQMNRPTTYTEIPNNRSTYRHSGIPQGSSIPSSGVDNSRLTEPCSLSHSLVLLFTWVWSIASEAKMAAKDAVQWEGGARFSGCIYNSLNCEGGQCSVLLWTFDLHRGKVFRGLLLSCSSSRWLNVSRLNEIHQHLVLHVSIGTSWLDTARGSQMGQQNWPWVQSRA